MEEFGFENENEKDDNVIKKFVLEIAGKLRNSSTIEFTNYEDALQSFDHHSKAGKNLILYEVHRSPSDGSVVKKVPILNTSKHAERMKILEEEAKANALSQPSGSNVLPGLSSSSSSTPGQKNKMTLSSMKYKIIILAAVVGGLIITLFLLNILASGGGNLAGHSILFDSVQNYFFGASIDANHVQAHPDLISVYFML